MKMEQKQNFSKHLVVIAVLLVLVAAFNVYALSSLSDSLSFGKGGSFAYQKDVSKVDLNTIKSTAQSVALMFPVNEIATTQDAIDIMIPTGTPEYGAALGVTFDDPIGSLNRLQKQVYPQIKAELKQDQELWNRYISLGTKPVGISCEFCCGVGPVGISSNGELKCGCSHNPAVQALAMWMIKNTDYSDQEVLREVLRWKALWFPKNMIQLAVQASDGEVDVNNLPGMVGGC